MESARNNRLLRLLDEADLAMRRGFSAAGRVLIRDIKLAIETSGDYAAKSLNDTLGFDRASAPNEDRLSALFAILLIEGRSATEWWKKIAGDAKFRFVQIIRDSYNRRRPLEEIVRAIRGTGEKRFNDGFLGTSWRAAAALARTAIAAGSESVKNTTWEVNAEAVGSVIQISVLDLKTCFVAGTPVLMADGGIKAIEDIQAGELVIGGSRNARPVVATKRSARAKLVQVTLDTGEKVRCTPDHLFRVGIDDQEWVEAADLQAGDVLSSVLK